MEKLEKVLPFSCVSLLEKIEDELGLNSEQAVFLQEDMLKFLFLCGTKNKGGADCKFSPPKKIDEAWHLFILHTKDYENFCNEYFGFFIHHKPFTRAEREENKNKGLLDKTITAAKKLFGDNLSENWQSKKVEFSCCGDCEECSHCSAECG